MCPHSIPHLLQILDWTMNLWDFKRFRLNDPALAHVYKSQGTLAKLVSTTGREIHREMESQLQGGEGRTGRSTEDWGLRTPGRRDWSRGTSVGRPSETEAAHQ